MGIKLPLAVVIGAVDNWTGALSKMQGRLNQTFAPVRELSAKVHALGEAAGVRRLGEAFSNVGTQVGNLGRRVAGVAAGIVASLAAAAAAVYSLALSTARVGNDAAKAAMKIGISVQTYQELAHAGKLLDVEQGAIDKGLQILVRTMGQAALGSKAAQIGFRRLGVQIKDSNGQLRPVGEVLGEIADRSRELADPLKKNAILTTIFGRSSADLIPLLSEGSEGLAAYAAEARALGVVLDRHGVEASEKFMDAQDRVQAAIQGVRNTIGVALLPVLTDLLDRLRDLALRYQPQIREWAQRFAEKLPERLERLSRLVAQLVEDLRPLVRWIGSMVERFGIARVSIVALSVALATFLVPAILSTIASLATLSVALVATPAGWVALAIAAIVLELTFLIAHTIYFWDTWVAAWKGATVTLQFYLAYWKSSIRGFVDGIVDYWTDKFSLLLSPLRAIRDLIPDELWKTLGIKVSTSAAGGAPAAGELAQAVGSAGVAPAPTASVRVEFENAPRGLRASSDSQGGVDVDLSLGYSLVGG